MCVKTNIMPENGARNQATGLLQTIYIEFLNPI